MKFRFILIIKVSAFGLKEIVRFLQITHFDRYLFQVIVHLREEGTFQALTFPTSDLTLLKLPLLHDQFWISCPLFNFVTNLIHFVVPNH